MLLAVKKNVVQINVMVRRNLIHVLRNSESLTMTFVLPIMVTLLFVYVFGGALGSGNRSEYLRYVLPGILIMSPAFGVYMTGIEVNNDMSKGIIDRFKTLDINQSSVIVGHMITSVVRNLLGTIFVVLFAVLIGFRTDVSVLNWLCGLGMMTLYILMISMISIVVGLFGKSPESVGGFMMLIQFAPYVSSAFVPTETMPAGLRAFSNHQPFTKVANTMRSLMLGTHSGRDWIYALLWCALVTILCLVLSRHLYQKKTT